MKTLVLSSNCSGGGKTTFTLGLMKALKNRGYKVQGFKSGPDYIDPAFHSKITKVDSRNLDLFLMGKEGVSESFNRGTGDFAIVEGVMGLYDGKGITDDYSTYSTSKALDNAPILLVISPKAQSLTICAEIKGLLEFRDANIVGVVLNNITPSYYVLLKRLIEENCNTKVFGYLPKTPEIVLESRHLGLVQSEEVEDLEEKMELCAKLIEKNVNIDDLIKSFKDVKLEKAKQSFELKNKGLKIGVAYDKAFRFYYKENLELLEGLGEVIYFSPINDKELPKGLDFLYIGGGYPEVFKEELSGNKSMLKSIKNALEKGLNCYAECGGLMYLNKSIDGYEMVGFFNGDSCMTGKLNNFGYADIEFNGIKINCHEFHKSKVEAIEKPIYKVKKINYAGNEKIWNCGYEKNNTLAGYPHIHFFGNLEFLKYILRESYKEE